jgi:hypothetical protein
MSRAGQGGAPPGAAPIYRRRLPSLYFLVYNDIQEKAMDICGVELTTCGILEDGHVVRLDLVDDKGMAISLRLPFEQAQAVAMTLPSLLTRALKSLTGSPNARYVFPLDRWFVELSGQRDGLLLTMATADGFQVSFGLPAEACRGLGLTLAGGPARLAEGDADDDELVSGSVGLN